VMRSYFVVSLRIDSCLAGAGGSFRAYLHFWSA